MNVTAVITRVIQRAGSVEPINVSESESDEDEEAGDGSADFDEVMTEEQANLMTPHMYSEFDDW